MFLKMSASTRIIRFYAIFALLVLTKAQTAVQSSFAEPNSQLIFPFPRPPPPPGPRVCDTAVCCELEKCDPGQFMVYADPDNNVCCNYCKDYSTLRQYCSYEYPNTQLCSPSLNCQPNNYDYNNGASPVSTCTYLYESFSQVNCSRPGCPTFCSCPDGQYLVKADNVTRCCDQCITYSKLGEYCDDNQRCYSNLQCGCDDICLPSPNCERVRCPYVDKCPDDSYFVAKDGLDNCCDRCQKYAAVGESCDYDRYCNSSDGYCDFNTYTCIAYPKLNCDSVECLSVENCTEIGGIVIEPDYINSCCAYCSLILPL